MTRDFTVVLSPEEVAMVIIDALNQDFNIGLFGNSTHADVVDDYRMHSSNKTSITLVFARFYVRVSGYVNLIVSINDLSGYTTVHTATGKHRSVALGKDGGAAAQLISVVEKALQDHLPNNKNNA